MVRVIQLDFEIYHSYIVQVWKKYKIMFSTYLLPYNLIQSEYQQFNYYAPTMMNLAYSSVQQALFPINLTSRTEVPET